jgi:hydroxyethylthiazole kinase
VANGHPLLPAVTGTGCAATALIGAFLAVDPDPLTAAATALAFFGIAGEAAGIQASGPGSFTVQLLDALYRLSPEEVIERCRISVG